MQGSLPHAVLELFQPGAPDQKSLDLFLKGY